MYDKFLHITKDDRQNTTSVYENYWLISWDITSFNPNNQNSVKVPKGFWANEKITWLYNFRYLV